MPEPLAERLSRFTPDGGGLDRDALLFAAGRASARPGPARFVWPALTAGLAALALALGVWLSAERSERLALAARLRQTAPAPAAVPPPPPAPAQPHTGDDPPASSVFAARHALEQGLDAWPSAAVRANPTGPPQADPPVLRVGRPDALPDL